MAAHLTCRLSQADSACRTTLPGLCLDLACINVQTVDGAHPVIKYLRFFVCSAGAEPLRIITPTTTVPNATAAASGNATAVGTNLAAAAAIPAVLDPVAAAEAATALPPPADPHQLLRTINTTDPTSPHYPMWQGAMQYLTAMAANASFQTQDTATAAAKGFVVRNGTQLYRHGKPFYFVGGNAYWIVDFYTMSWGRDKIDEFFDSCQVSLALRITD